MSTNFTNFKEAMKYAVEMRTRGFKTYVEEFYTLNSRIFTVLIWEK